MAQVVDSITVHRRTQVCVDGGLGPVSLQNGLSLKFDDFRKCMDALQVFYYSAESDHNNVHEHTPMRTEMQIRLHVVRRRLAASTRACPWLTQ